MKQNPDLYQLMKLAQSPAGQQFLQLLQKQGGSELEAAAKTAASGDIKGAMNAIAPLLSKPEISSLLKQLEEQK